MKKIATSIARMMPCSVVLLSAGSGRRRDAMTATAMFVSEELPLFVVSVAMSMITLIEPPMIAVMEPRGSAQGSISDGFKN